MDSHQIMSEFSKLNQKSILKSSEMVTDYSYKILKARRVKTKFGNKVLLELENNILFLPARFNKISDEVITNLSLGAYMVYRTTIDDGKTFQLRLNLYTEMLNDLQSQMFYLSQ